MSILSAYVIKINWRKENEDLENKNKKQNKKHCHFGEIMPI